VNSKVEKIIYCTGKNVAELGLPCNCTEQKWLA